MSSTQRIAPCLWFADQAEEAARFYTGIFKNSKIGKISRYGEAGREIHLRPPGSVMTVAFELDGVSRQVVPTALTDMFSDPKSEKSQRAVTALLQMKKLDIAKLEQA